VKTAPEPVEISPISREIYLSAIDLASCFKISGNDLSRMARSGVLARVPHPEDTRAYLYPLVENTTRYVLHLRSAKEKCYLG
jgi:hypothetical protein